MKDPNVITTTEQEEINERNEYDLMLITSKEEYDLMLNDLDLWDGCE